MVIRYRSPSVLWAIDRLVVLTGLGFVIASLNVAIRAFRTEFRDEFSSGGICSSRQRPPYYSCSLVRDPPSVCGPGTWRKLKRRRV
jgi:hypothetical protein